MSKLFVTELIHILTVSLRMRPRLINVHRCNLSVSTSSQCVAAAAFGYRSFICLLSILSLSVGSSCLPLPCETDKKKEEARGNLCPLRRSTQESAGVTRDSYEAPGGGGGGRSLGGGGGGASLEGGGGGALEYCWMSAFKPPAIPGAPGAPGGGGGGIPIPGGAPGGAP